MISVFRFLDAVSVDWWQWMSRSSLQLVVFGSAVFLLSTLLRHRPARFLYWLWYAVVVQALLPPEWPFALSFHQRALPAWTVLVFPGQSIVPGGEGSSLSPINWRIVLFSVWLLVVLLLFGYVLLRNVRFFKQLSLAEDFSHRSYNGQIRVKRVPWAGVPFSWGLFRPTIFLPAEAENWSTKDLNVVLAHESAHIRNGDLWLALPLLAAQVLFFFHPVIWLVTNRLRALRESSCDDRVLEETGVDPLEYSRFLLRHLKNAHATALGPVIVHCLHLGKHMQVQRFRYLIQRREKTMRRKSVTDAFLLGLVLLLAVTLPMLQCSKKEPVKPEAEATSRSHAPLQSQVVNYDVPPQPEGGMSALVKDVLARSRNYNATGTVIVHVEIDEKGRVQKTQYDVVGGNFSAKAAQVVEEAIKKVKWTPAKKNGHPVRTTIRIPIVYKSGTSIQEATPPPPPPEAGGGIFVPYDHPPEPVGGFKAIQSHLKYPEAARRENIQGSVIVHVLIDEQGKVVDARILKSLSPECDQAAIYAVKNTEWRPAKQKDKPVRVWVSIPVMFRLKK